MGWTGPPELRKQEEGSSMEIIDYYNEKKWCESCTDYVSFLMSVERSYCVNCGSPVRLFSKQDLKAFTEGMQREKGGGPRRRSMKAS